MLYKRIMLKLSGEGLMGDKEYGMDMLTVSRLAQDIKSIHASGVEVVITVGGGNIFRGVKGAAAGMDRASADYMGMLATIMNALALQDSIEKQGIETRVTSAIMMRDVCETFIRRRAIRHLEKGRVVICAGGTGNPFFTTDSAAALRAAELHCDVLLKATQVDGVYSADPKKDKTAIRYDKLSYDEVINKNLQVMDTAAIALARENKLPIVVFPMNIEGSLTDVVKGQGVFTLVSDK